MDAEKIPLIFANRAIRTFVDNQLGGDTLVLPDDYMTMRLVYRKCQGSWEKLSNGDAVHINLLARIVKSWGKLREKKRKVEVV